jgi:tetratricopeptide (TPR) repeat protein
VQAGHEQSTRTEVGVRRWICASSARWTRAVTVGSFALIACLASLSTIARAQTAPVPKGSDLHQSLRSSDSSPPPEALDHYASGRKYYLAGRYRDALVELKAALEYDPRSPDLIYNVARVYENLGEFDEAIEHYQRYMDVLPLEAADERDRTQKTIGRLQGAKSELAERERERAADEVEKPHVGRADVAFWLTGSAAIGLLGVGGASGVLALKKTDDVAAFVVGKDGTFARRKDLSKQADRFALGADLFLGAGALALTGAALLFFLRDSEPDKPDDDTPTLSFAFDGRNAQLDVRGSF